MVHGRAIPKVIDAERRNISLPKAGLGSSRARIV
jgi:hypothetical protein